MSVTQGANWTLVNGDSCEELPKLDADSVDLSVYSVPFLSLYVYSPNERDLGNCKTETEFFEHFGYIQRELLRVTKPGRLTCCHVAQVPAMLSRDGYIGLKDFRGDTIRSFKDQGWIHHGEIVIQKNPQAQAVRTKSKGLLFVQLDKDSTWSRPGLADFVLVFRKPGENAVPVKPDVSHEEWIRFAHPVWFDIQENDTLNAAIARENDDERHLAPLQLGTIERCIRLWSNPGDLVVSPFTGIASEGFEAVRLGRRFWGCELKPSYARVAVRNLQTAETLKTQGSLLDEAHAESAQSADKGYDLDEHDRDTEKPEGYWLDNGT